MMPRHIVVKLTADEAATVLAALDLHQAVVEEGTGHRDAANTRATRKIEAARDAARRA